MKYTFFEEYEDQAFQQSAGNVIAVYFSNELVIKDGNVLFRAVCADEECQTPNGPVTPTFFEAEYLGTHCRKISEERARDIHPKLFEYLDTLA
ncbi:MAG: hypothetical protein M3081_19215 [Gemmatimonadota bacterium]|nr:hypothetical protein [Gemmatimonadota bacterium]